LFGRSVNDLTQGGWTLSAPANGRASMPGHDNGLKIEGELKGIMQSPRSSIQSNTPRNCHLYDRVQAASFFLHSSLVADKEVGSFGGGTSRTIDVP
jgi:hypothetical protein